MRKTTAKTKARSPGRPSLGKDAVVPLPVRVKATTAAAVKQAAASRNTTASELIRELLERHFGK